MLNSKAMDLRRLCCNRPNPYLTVTTNATNNLCRCLRCKNATNIDAAATVVYKGVTYSVADNDESYTKDVMEFMATLVTIAKIPGAIPASPAVVVR